MEDLKKRGCRKVYLIHDPEDEQKARAVAQEMRSQGFTVIVAADVRPANKSPDEATPEELKKVDDAIASCDCRVVLRED